MSSSNLSVRGKLLTGFSVLLILIVVVATTSLIRMASVNDQLKVLLEDRYAKTKLSTDTITRLVTMRVLLRDAVLADDTNEAEKALERVVQLRDQNGEALDKIKAMGAKSEEFTKVIEARAVVRPLYDPLFSAIRKRDFSAAKANLKGEFAPAMQNYVTALSTYVKFNEGKMIEAQKEMAALYQQTRVILVGTSLFAIALGIAIAVLIANNLGHRIGFASSMAARISEGDLSQQPNTLTASNDEVGKLLGSLETMRRRLLEIVSAITAEAHSVASASTELSAAAEQVSASTAHQASSTSAAAAAVEELTVSIDHVAANADSAHQQAIDAGGLAHASGLNVRSASQQIGSVAESMEVSGQSISSLSQKVQQIGNVTVVIREVADQTNLLALNAAIEAARAGETGRGFAVVADEVRKLAERTSASVQEISSMITAVQAEAGNAVETMESSRGLVGTVVSTAESAEQSMGSIQSVTGQVQGAVAEISQALNEQRIASTELAKSVEAVAQMSEENLAAIGSVAETARSLADSSNKLQVTVQFFKT